MGVNKYTVVSLFDGLSCGQIALDQLGVHVDKYYASEVDKYAIQVTQHNYPNTIQVGDVSKLRVRKMVDGSIRMYDEFGNKHKISGKIILHGGSPCQGFSFAGKQKGASTKCKIDITSLEQYLILKKDGFEFDGQSYLFWEYIRILRIIEPDVFLLENVKMAKKWHSMFNEAVGVDAIMINSALVSAQNRNRLYWTNIKGIKQPEDRGIVIADILEDDGIEDGRMTTKENKSYSLTASYNGAVLWNSIERKQRTMVRVGAMRGRYLVDGKRQDYKMKTAGLTTQRIEVRSDDKSNCLTTVQKDNLIVSTIPTLIEFIRSGGTRREYISLYRSNNLIVPEATKKGHTVIKPGECFDATFIKSKTRRGRNMSKKSNCLTAANYNYMKYEGEQKYRKLTPVECEALQTIPKNYTNVVSNSQRYKMLGNSWTNEVIKHIYSSGDL